LQNVIIVVQDDDGVAGDTNGNGYDDVD